MEKFSVDGKHELLNIVIIGNDNEKGIKFNRDTTARGERKKLGESGEAFEHVITWRL